MSDAVHSAVYEVRWEYTHLAPPTPVLWSSVTACIIELVTLDGRTPVMTGHAYCSKSDAFVKAIGRKISFGQAIQGLTKQVRSVMWAHFWKEFKRPA